MRAPFISNVIVTTILCCCATTAWAVELPREMSAQYRTAVERLREVYGHATVTGTLKHELPQAHKFREQDFIFRASGQMLRIDLTTRAEKGMGLEVGAADMYMAAPYASLHTYRGPTSQVFDTADEESYGTAKSHIDAAFTLSKLFTLGGRETVIELLQSQNVTLTSVRKITVDGTQLVKINFQQTTQSGGSKVWKSWVAVSPTEGWAIREYSRTTDSGSSEVTYRGTITYNGMQDDVPILQQIETWQEQGANRKCVQHDVINVSGFTPGDPDHDYFAAFGLGPGRNPGGTVSPVDTYNR